MMLKKGLTIPVKIFDYLITENGSFPNNSTYPLLHYKTCFQLLEPEFITLILLKNGWKNTWRNGIYPYHHYHSNTHEVLVVYEGSCKVQVGGMAGKIIEIQRGDILINPAGVAHKNHECSDDFKCIGAYPEGKKYDMMYGKETESAKSKENISHVLVPEMDPLYGEHGPLFEYWKN